MVRKSDTELYHCLSLADVHTIAILYKQLFTDEGIKAGLLVLPLNKIAQDCCFRMVILLI